jgi:hypothetical protein
MKEPLWSTLFYLNGYTICWEDGICCETCTISNKPVDINCENTCDIRFKSQFIRN